MNRWRFSILVAIGILGLTAGSAAGPGRVAGPALAQGSGQASYGGITFSYDTTLATNVRGQTLPSTLGQGGPFSELRPEHIDFSFAGYAAPGVWSPQIRIIPLAAYQAALAESGAGVELDALARYLAGDPQRRLPVLPATRMARIINEQVAPVAGGGGSGVRFIAAYAQGIVAVQADNITYIYLGLTADRRYYVEGTFPVSLSAPLDPAPSPITVENAQAYNQAVAARLRQTDMAGFTPPLDTLDKMMASIRVTPAGIPGMPTTGAHGFPPADLIMATLALATLLILGGLALATRAKAAPVW